MPLQVDDKTPGKFPNPEYLTLSSIKRGVITLIDKSRLPKDAAQEMDNLFLVEDGQPSLRPGVNWFGSAISATAQIDPIVTTNLVTNPSFEVDLTGWSSSGTITRVTSDFNTGTACMKLVSGANNYDARYAVSGLTVGQYYALSVYMKGTAGNTLYLNGTFSPASETTLTATGGWDRLTFIGIADSTSGDIQVIDSTSLTSHTTYIDSVQLEEGTVATDYFDGSLADDADTVYAWTGSANASTSTRTQYTLSAAQIDGFDYFDNGGEIHLVAACGGTVFRSLDDGVTWDTCSGGTLTANEPVSMNQNNAFLYLTTGVDNILRYDGTTTLQAYTALTTPSAATAATTPGSPGTGYTYYYKISSVNQVGFSAASASVTVVHGVPRDSWDPTTNYITLTLPAYQATQTRYDIFISEDNIDYFYLDSIVGPNLTYKDDGTAIVVPSTLAPTDNTTQGPKYAELTNVGSRMYGVRDPNNRYRIGFTGTGNYSGAFSGAYDGGYLDWQPGGKFIPVKVADYRDGKGTPLATIWCDSADGQGCVLQMSLDTLTIQDISITVPSAYRLPGSRGTPAPGSVVNVLNDYMFYNTQAFYNIGSRPQLLQVLSTDEYSANIRPTVKQIATASEAGIASVYYDAKVYFSVGFGSDTNNTTIVYDTERKAWLPTAFTIGFSKFLRYTTTTGARKLLALRPGDNRLSEISETIQGDYGVPFRTSLLTGLYPTGQDRFEFQFTEEGELELSNARGRINWELLGYERKHGYTVIKQRTEDFSSGQSGVGWDTFAWDTNGWDDTSDIPSTVSSPSDYRYFTVQKELNSVQWHVTTNTLSANYVLRTLQTWGTPTQAGHPSGWRAR